jgi:thiamine biosynthesis lipoprotein
LNLERAIVDIGGNIVVLGSKPWGQPWRIGVQDPFEPRGAFCGVIELKDATAVTSGVYERYFEQDGRRYHHILDTRTGYPVEGPLVSITVVADESMAADALATGVFSMGAAAGVRFVSSFPDIEAVFVFRDRQVYVTEGLSERFDLTGSEFTPSTPP